MKILKLTNINEIILIRILIPEARPHTPIRIGGCGLAPRDYESHTGM
jgi:hypothetical protein